MAFSNPQEDPTRATVQGVAKPAEPQVPAGMKPAAGTGPAPQDEGVASRVATITAEDSPIMRQARASGMRQGAARGLLNSSISVGAAEDAAYRAATPMAAQEASQAAATNSQSRDIAAQMERMRTQAGFEDVRQDKEIGARFGILDKEFKNQSGLSAQNYTQTLGVNAEQNKASMEQLRTSQTGDVQRLQMQINSAEGQQKVGLQAEMDRLVASNQFELQRMDVSNGFNVAMAGIQQGNAEAMAKLQSSLSSTLQAQANTEQMQRMVAEFTNQQQLSAQGYQQTLGQIAAAGDVDMKRAAQTIAASLQELTLNLNQRNTEAAVNAAVNLFNAEASIRASIMSNPEMPAATRQQYMASVGMLTGPTRDFIQASLGPGFNAPAPGAAPAPGMAPPPPPGIPGQPLPAYSPPPIGMAPPPRIPGIGTAPVVASAGFDETIYGGGGIFSDPDRLGGTVRSV